VAIVITIRSMGVVLLSAMLVVPPVTARLLTANFNRVVWLGALIGACCGFGGVLLSHVGGFIHVADRSLWLPTGPLIALLLTLCFCAALFFSPSHGLAIRAWRRWVFVRRCQRENALKLIWKECVGQGTWVVSAAQFQEIVPVARRSVLRRLQCSGLLTVHPDGRVEMTQQGMLMGRKLVRLHRLWELYLVEYCGMAKERVHPRAEEMEHILTPEVEQKLAALLHNPSMDPHQQPIPSS
jgi:manganese/zinc/iron transport system permease protein